MIATLDSVGLLKAIIDDPQDDLPRLAFADWCEENGDDTRAEFIRVQVELAAMPECRHEPPKGAGGQMGWMCSRCDQREFLQYRAGDLKNATRSTPWSHLDIVPGYSAGWFWRRGFLAEIRCPLVAWLQHGQALAAAHPLERAELSGCEPLFAFETWRLWRQREDVPPDGSDLPGEVFGLLEGGVLVEGSTSVWREYPTEEAAVDALSAALIANARSK
jgi:uncharacterized protein (TIGR02996 family)